MIYGLLLTLFIINCFALILLVLMQKGKGGMGLGSMGGGTTMLFGGSGGQDFFQKLSWTLGAIFMAGSLLLGIMKSSLYNVKYINFKEAPQQITPEEAVLDEQEALPPQSTKTEPQSAKNPETATQSLKVESSKAEAAKAEPAKTVPRKTEPVTAVPAKAEPVKTPQSLQPAGKQSAPSSAKPVKQ